MATADLTRDALQQVIDTMAHLDELLTAFDDLLKGESPPPWLPCIRRSFDPMEQAFERLECILRRDVLPALDAQEGTRHG